VHFTGLRPAGVGARPYGRSAEKHKLSCVFQQPVVSSPCPRLCCPVLAQTGLVTPFAQIYMVLLREYGAQSRGHRITAQSQT